MLIEALFTVVDAETNCLSTDDKENVMYKCDVHTQWNIIQL